jgi:catechol 2,3-dioxygenase-like lactoylglutathione lyase family enzyme
MEFHRGRMIDHVHLRVADFEASLRFYRTILAVVGREVTDGEIAGERYFSCDELWVTPGPKPTTGLHLAFQAADRATVDRFWEVARAAGARDNGSPGERDYHPGYYAAFVFDPDGNNIEAVYHGPAKRSAESVVFSVGDLGPDPPE